MTRPVGIHGAGYGLATRTWSDDASANASCVLDLLRLLLAGDDGARRGTLILHLHLVVGEVEQAQTHLAYFNLTLDS